MPQDALKLSLIHISSSQNGAHVQNNWRQRTPLGAYKKTKKQASVYELSLIHIWPAQRASELLQPLTKVAETYHPGEFPQSYSGLALCEPNIILSALKKAHHAEGYILRAYETDEMCIRDRIFGQTLILYFLFFLAGATVSRFS